MSEQYGEFEEYEEQQQPQQEQRSNAEWAALRKEKRSRGKAEQERDEARKALAFMQAGIDPSDARLGYFVRGYQGEVNPNAIRDAAIAAGFIQSQTGPSPEQQAALIAQQRMSNAAAAGTPVEEGDAAQQQALSEAYAQGGTAGVMAKMAELGIPIQAN